MLSTVLPVHIRCVACMVAGLEWGGLVSVSEMSVRAQPGLRRCWMCTLVELLESKKS